MSTGGVMDTFVSRPSAAILIGSLRGFPYTLETALADIIDNAITAGAERVRIFADANAGFPRIAVIDDGSGMDLAELREAMRLGSKDPAAVRQPNDLGRFGLGLKTASFSQCRRLTVASTRDGNIHAARWDLRYVYETDEWTVQVISEPQKLPWVDEIGKHGTLVLWEDLDRVIDSESLGEVANEFNHRVSRAASHIEQVFHRFMEGERNLSKVAISLNGSELVPHNPFNPKNRATIVDQAEAVGIADMQVDIRAYTLPHFSKVSADEWDEYAGERGYLRNQGFYLYRAGRLIVHGTWFGLMRQTELTKLARVQIDIPNGMDELWKIDVLKASAHPPHLVRQRLRAIIDRLVKNSRGVHINRGRKMSSSEQFPLWERRTVHEGVRYGINLTHPAVVGISESLDPAEQTQFRRLLQLVAAGLPIDSLIVDLGEKPHQTRGEDVPEDALELLVSTMCTQLRGAGLAWPDVEESMRANAFLSSNWEKAEPLLAEFRVADEG